MKRLLELGKEYSTKVRRSRQKAVGFRAWRTGSFKPVGDGFEDGVLFCLLKASACFSGSVVVFEKWILIGTWKNKR